MQFHCYVVQLFVLWIIIRLSLHSLNISLTQFVCKLKQIHSVSPVNYVYRIVNVWLCSGCSSVVEHFLIQTRDPVFGFQ